MFLQKEAIVHGKFQTKKIGKKPFCPNFLDLINVNQLSSDGSKPVLTEECATCENAPRCLQRYAAKANRPLFGGENQ
jgi:hypothetical protein